MLFNKIFFTRLPSKAKAQMASGQGSQCVTRPAKICVNFVLNIFMLLAVTQSVDALFH